MMSHDSLCLCHSQPAQSRAICPECCGSIPTDDVLREKIGKLVTVRSFLKPTGVSPLDVLRQVLDRPDYDRMRAVLVRQLAEAFDGHNVNPCASVVDLG